MSKKQIYIIAAVLLFLVILGWYFYRRGKKAATGPDVKFEEGTNALPAGWSPMPLVEELHDVMAGFFTSPGAKNEAWEKLYNLPTGDMIRAVYKAFNEKYFRDGYGTLTQWIRDENHYAYLSSVKQKTLEKLSSLGLA